MNRPKLIILCGIPGAGKTHYAKNYIALQNNTIHLSSDSIRAELYGDESTQGNPAEVFGAMQKRAVDALNNGKDVIYDSTAMTRKDRQGIISVCPKFAKIACYIIWAPIEECIARDKMRDITVGKEVIDRMLKRFQAPYYDEGIDEIKIITPEMFNADDYTDSIFLAMNIPHDNPHHSLNIEDHCVEAYKYLSSLGIKDYDLMGAALFHDVGKPYVKAFVDSKGNHCDVAHYYQHQSVGAYMFYGSRNANPHTAWLISTHMEPFFNSKYYKNLPPFLKKDIDLLHEADLNAH